MGHIIGILSLIGMLVLENIGNHRKHLSDIDTGILLLYF